MSIGFYEFVLGEASIVSVARVADQLHLIIIVTCRFWAVSEPTSPSYGRFLTPAQVAALVAPSPASQQTILQWLEAHGTLPLYFKLGKMKIEPFVLSYGWMDG